MVFSQSDRRLVTTDRWSLTVPSHVTADSPLLVIPTIHPRGDQRVIRCAQVALDSGFRLKFIWLGDGIPCKDPSIEEQIFPVAYSLSERLKQIPKICRHAMRSQARLCHIHDFYLLPLAILWRLTTKRPAVYDVHEFYGILYSERAPLPGLLRRLLRKVIDMFEVVSANYIGGANVAAAAMASSFSAKKVPLAVTPNYPLLDAVSRQPVLPFDNRRRRVIYTGSLSKSYGMYLLLDIVSECNRRSLDVQFVFVRRFHQRRTEAEFFDYLKIVGPLPNLSLIDPVPANELAGLISTCGIGLSTLLVTGQNELGVPTKLFEYACVGLVMIGTDNQAQSDFMDDWGTGIHCSEDDLDCFVTSIARVAYDEEYDWCFVMEQAEKARHSLVWDKGPSESLAKLYKDLLLKDYGS